MNQKWRILLGISLVVMICVPLVSAALQIPTIKHSYSRLAFDQYKTTRATQNTYENIQIRHKLPDIQTYDPLKNIRKPDFSIYPSDPAMPEIPQNFISTRIIIPYSDIYITKERAIAIALAQFPSINPQEPITATLEQIHAPAYPLATNPCWVVEINGCYPIFSDPPYGGIIFIDAVTGEVLYIAFLM
ncbi:MAG: Peptidase propeptide and YPEB domain protein [Methanoregulaceae archaeon PtaB.Bin108]|nr:MAG: Peptidase propeptide and YPEB domain protein [Methanoregulaceae archaeon PtaB.Bin108]